MMSTPRPVRWPLRDSPGLLGDLPSRPRRLHPLGLVLALGLAGGCGSTDPLGRQAVSGFVTFDGAALGDGVILLEPMATTGPETAVGATIRGGAFAIARDQGPRPGSYRVRIYSSSGIQPPPAPGRSERTRRPMVERLPEAYNAKSELHFDVIAGGPNRLRLELRGDGG